MGAEVLGELIGETVRMPVASVVIPTLNGADSIGRQLEALSVGQPIGKFEIIVADNGSIDNLREVVRTFGVSLPGLRLVDASGRRGINHARNVGAEHASSEYILFCDDDDAVDQGWVAGMSQALDSFDGAGGLLRTLNGDSWSEPSVPERLLAEGWRRSPVGACCGVRRSVWKALEGFDERLDRGAGDETEFFWRLQRSGYTLGVAGNASIRYTVTSSLRLRAKKSYRSARERQRLLYWTGESASWPQFAAQRSNELIGLARISVAVARGRTSPGYLLSAAASLGGSLVGRLLYRNEESAA